LVLLLFFYLEANFSRSRREKNAKNLPPNKKIGDGKQKKFRNHKLAIEIYKVLFQVQLHDPDPVPAPRIPTPESRLLYYFVI